MYIRPSSKVCKISVPKEKNALAPSFISPPKFSVFPSYPKFRWFFAYFKVKETSWTDLIAVGGHLFFAPGGTGSDVFGCGCKVTIWT